MTALDTVFRPGHALWVLGKGFRFGFRRAATLGILDAVEGVGRVEGAIENRFYSGAAKARFNGVLWYAKYPRHLVNGDAFDSHISFSESLKKKLRKRSYFPIFY
jgi:hypothetical protein